jgi:BirA family biotin operon repressor/biotin-[acetyl-CoA-carboxylase] ligase
MGKIHRYDSVTSTMDVCREMAENGAEEFTIIIADEQTKGRGRVGREWFSPPGQSLYLSVLLRPALLPSQLNWITMIAALSVVDTLDRIARVENSNPVAALKWFNDVLLNDKKVAGILVESSLMNDRVHNAVMGIGLNVNTDFSRAPEDVQARATSIKVEFGRSFDREDVLRLILTNFASRYEQLIDTRNSPASEYAKRLSTLGKYTRIRIENEIIEGIASHIEDDGALIVTTTSGEKRIRFGDVES